MTLEDQVIALQADVTAIKTLLESVKIPDVTLLETKLDVLVADVTAIKAQFAATTTTTTAGTPTATSEAPSA